MYMKHTDIYYKITYRYTITPGSTSHKHTLKWWANIVLAMAWTRVKFILPYIFSQDLTLMAGRSVVAKQEKVA